MMLPLGDEQVPGRGLALVTLSFIAINIAVFVLLQLPPGGDRFTYGYSVIPQEITTGKDLVRPETVSIDGQRVRIPEERGPSPIYLTLLTSMFMHGGWLHLGGNMLFLWIFGDNVEHTFGPLFYGLFYLVAGIIASLAQVWVGPDSVIPSLGASGAIAGVLGAYIVLFPRNRVRVLFGYFVIDVPAVVMIGAWAITQFLSGYAAIATTEQTAGIAYMAHVGGFVTGFVVGLLARAGGLGGGRTPRTAYGFG